MRIIHRNIVSALIFSKDGKLLMGMKDPASGGVYADCWHIPGGGVDEIETRPSDDLVKLAWVDPTKLDRYKLTPPSVLLFKRLEQKTKGTTRRVQMVK